MQKTALITLDNTCQCLTSFGDWNWCCSLIDVEEPISEPCSVYTRETAIILQLNIKQEMYN